MTYFPYFIIVINSRFFIFFLLLFLGCNAGYDLPSEGQFVSFIYQCQVATVGDDLQGSKCRVDSDCQWGGSCVNGYFGLRFLL